MSFNDLKPPASILECSGSGLSSAELQSTCSKEAGGGHDNDLGILSTSLSIAPFSGSVTITSAYFNVLLPLIGPYCSKKSTFLGVFLLNLIILSTQKADDIWQKFLGF